MEADSVRGHGGVSAGLTAGDSPLCLVFIQYRLVVPVPPVFAMSLHIVCPCGGPSPQLRFSAPWEPSHSNSSLNSNNKPLMTLWRGNLKAVSGLGTAAVRYGIRVQGPLQRTPSLPCLPLAFQQVASGWCNYRRVGGVFHRRRLRDTSDTADPGWRDLHADTACRDLG